METKTNTQTSEYKTICGLLEKIPANNKFYKLTPEQAKISKQVIADFNMVEYELCNCGSCIRRLEPIPTYENFNYKRQKKE